MQMVRLTVMTLFLATSFACGASALSVDDSGASKGNAANFGDPDDKVPYPHVADDGSQSNLQGGMQPVGNSGLSFGVTGGAGAPASGSPDAAFQRAQERMQQ